MKQFKVKLDKQRVLKLTNRTIMDMEDHFGGSPLNAIGFKVGNESEMMLNLASLSFLHKIVYFGLKHAEDCPSMDECIDLIPMNRATALATKCFELLDDAYGLSDSVDESELNQNGMVVGTGQKQKKSDSAS